MIRPPVRRIGQALLVMAIMGSSMIHVIAPVSPFDDAFITFRYVENLLGGRGAVYNTGERVFGISCPLYAAWLALLKLAVPMVPLPVLAARANLIFLEAAALLAYLLLRRAGLGAVASSLAGAAIAISEGMLRPSIGAMESSLFIALLFGALLARAGGRDTTALLLAALSALTRPEGLLLVVAVLVAVYLDPVRRRGDHRPLLGLLPIAVWIIAALIYYGTPIPHSVTAKARPLYPLPAGAALDYLVTQSGHWTLDGLLAIGSTVSDKIGAHLIPRPFPRTAYRVAGIVLILWMLARWWRFLHAERAPRILALPAYLVILMACYALSNPLLLAWYLPLLYAPVLAMAVAAGVAPGGAGRWKPAFHRMVLSLVLMTAAASLFYSIGPSSRSLIQNGATDARQAGQGLAYARAAAWIELNTRASESVAAPEIGVLGYSLDRRILDACGLVTPAALPFIPVPPGQRSAQLGPISAEFVKATGPDLVVTLPAFAERTLFRSAWFASAYGLIHEEPFIPGEPGFRAVLVFEKRNERKQ